jgi:hypothetical protein
MGAYIIPIRPLLSSELPLPQMNLPENTRVSCVMRNGETSPASYRHNTQSKGDMSTLQQSWGRQEPHLPIKGASAVLELAPMNMADKPWWAVSRSGLRLSFEPFHS